MRVQVHEFFFYVLCEGTAEGEALVGYFSREKRSEANHLACILTMPHRQRKGYGGLLIDFSYVLARLAEKPGSPERPLSDLGQVRIHHAVRVTRLAAPAACDTRCRVCDIAAHAVPSRR